VGVFFVKDKEKIFVKDKKSKEPGEKFKKSGNLI
jgi:hypothetical protein